MEMKNEADKKENFLNYIMNTQDMEDILNNVCDQLQKFVST